MLDDIDSSIQHPLPTSALFSQAISDVQKLDAIDADDIGQIWSAFTKCKAAIQDGERWENLSWRLWFRECKAAGLVHGVHSGDELHRPTLFSTSSDSADSHTSCDLLSIPSSSPPSPRSLHNASTRKLKNINTHPAHSDLVATHAPGIQSCPAQAKKLLSDPVQVIRSHQRLVRVLSSIQDPTQDVTSNLHKTPMASSSASGSSTATAIMPLRTEQKRLPVFGTQEGESSQLTAMPPPTTRAPRPNKMFYINTPIRDGGRRLRAEGPSDEEESGSSYGPASPMKGPQSTLRPLGQGSGLRPTFTTAGHRTPRAIQALGNRVGEDEDEEDDEDDSSAWGSAYTSSAASSLKEKNMFPKVPTRSSTHLPSLVETQLVDDGSAKPGLLTNLFRTASHKTLKRTQTAPLSRPLSRQVSPTQTLSDLPTTKITRATRYRPSSKSQVDVPLAHATLAAPSASVSTSNIMSTSHGGSRQTADEMIRSQRSSSRQDLSMISGQPGLKRISTYAGPLTNVLRPMTTMPNGPSISEHSSALDAVRSMARSKRTSHHGESGGKSDSSHNESDSIQEEDEEDEEDEEEDDAFVAPVFSPRTTRKYMLATELSESLRKNLIWESRQRIALPKTKTVHGPIHGFGNGVKPLQRGNSDPDQRAKNQLMRDDNSPTSPMHLLTSSMDQPIETRQEQFRKFFMEDPGYHAVGW